MSAPVVVTQSFAGASVDHSGTYVLQGRFRRGNVYFCSSNNLYLLKNAEGHWMFSFHEAGGDDGLSGTAVYAQTDGTQGWRILLMNGEFSMAKKEALSITRAPVAPPKASMRLSQEQADI